MKDKRHNTRTLSASRIGTLHEAFTSQLSKWEEQIVTDKTEDFIDVSIQLEISMNLYFITPISYYSWVISSNIVYESNQPQGNADRNCGLPWIRYLDNRVVRTRPPRPDY